MMPLEVRLVKDRLAMAVTWDDGTVTQLSAAVLRRGSRAASAVRASLDGHSHVPDEEIKLVDVMLVGSYAVRLSFSDGHDRGIYPWSYLRELAEEAAT